MGVGSGVPGGSWSLWIFIHGTDIVDRGLIVLFFGIFFRWPTSWKRLNSSIFQFFGLFFGLFPVALLGKFSADAFGSALSFWSCVRTFRGRVFKIRKIYELEVAKMMFRLIDLHNTLKACQS